MNIYTLFGMLFAGLALGLFIAGARSTKSNLTLLPTTLIPENGAITQTQPTNFQSVAPGELFANPEKYLNKNVEVVDYMTTNSNWYSPPEFSSGVWLKIPSVPASVAHLDKGFQKVRLQGKFIEPGENAGSKYAIEIQKMEVMPFDKNYQDVNKTEMDEIIKNPGNKDRQWIRYEGNWKSGFEVSQLDEDIWLDLGLVTEKSWPEQVNLKSEGSNSQKVRVTGLLYNNTQNYGHLGSGTVEILADSIEFINN